VTTWGGQQKCFEGQLNTTTNPEVLKKVILRAKKVSPELDWCFELVMMPAYDWFEFLLLVSEILGDGPPVPPEMPRNPPKNRCHELAV
jgi:hypothetical protein